MCGWVVRDFGSASAGRTMGARRDDVASGGVRAKPVEGDCRMRVDDESVLRCVRASRHRGVALTSLSEEWAARVRRCVSMSECMEVRGRVYAASATPSAPEAVRTAWKSACSNEEEAERERHERRKQARRACVSRAATTEPRRVHRRLAVPEVEKQASLAEAGLRMEAGARSPSHHRPRPRWF